MLVPGNTANVCLLSNDNYGIPFSVSFNLKKVSNFVPETISIDC